MSEHYNLEFGKFSGVGKYTMPEIKPVYELKYPDRWIEFDYANRNKYHRDTIGIHFFERDYKFARVWETPNKYVNLLSEYSCVLSPDYSMYADYPVAMQIWNLYRNCWCARFWQEKGITVIPSVMWGDKDSYDWCFDGMPKKSIVAVSCVGNHTSPEDRAYFLNGYTEMLNRLDPKEVLMWTRDFNRNFEGPVHYIKWELFKGEQLNGK